MFNSSSSSFLLLNLLCFVVVEVAVNVRANPRVEVVAKDLLDNKNIVRVKVHQIVQIVTEFAGCRERLRQMVERNRRRVGFLDRSPPTAPFGLFWLVPSGRSGSNVLYCTVPSCTSVTPPPARGHAPRSIACRSPSVARCCLLHHAAVSSVSSDVRVFRY